MSDLIVIHFPAENVCVEASSCCDAYDEGNTIDWIEVKVELNESQLKKLKYLVDYKLFKLKKEK